MANFRFGLGAMAELNLIKDLVLVRLSANYYKEHYPEVIVKASKISGAIRLRPNIIESLMVF